TPENPGLNEYLPPITAFQELVQSLAREQQPPRPAGHRFEPAPLDQAVDAVPGRAEIGGRLFAGQIGTLYVQSVYVHIHRRTFSSCSASSDASTIPVSMVNRPAPGRRRENETPPRSGRSGNACPSDLPAGAAGAPGFCGTLGNGTSLPAL